MVDRIWAPWRYAYLKGENDRMGKGCIFCDNPKENDDKRSLVICRGRRSFVMMNRYPYINGHLLIAPYRHIDELGKCDREEQLEIMELMTDSITALRQSIQSQAFNIGMNMGKAAGAGFEEHIHFHVVPRWNGDTNFMASVSDVRVISMSLEEGWKIISEKFRLLGK